MKLQILSINLQQKNSAVSQYDICRFKQEKNRKGDSELTFNPDDFPGELEAIQLEGVF